MYSDKTLYAVEFVLQNLVLFSFSLLSDYLTLALWHTVRLSIFQAYYTRILYICSSVYDGTGDNLLTCSSLINNATLSNRMHYMLTSHLISQPPPFDAEIEKISL